VPAFHPGPVRQAAGAALRADPRLLAATWFNEQPGPEGPRGPVTASSGVLTRTMGVLDITRHSPRVADTAPRLRGTTLFPITFDHAET
jgi:hypothetical protein